MKYARMCLITNESIRNLGNMQEYFRENTERFVTFHYPHGYLRKASYMDVYSTGRLVLHKDFPIVPVASNVAKQFAYFLYMTYVLLFHVPGGSYVLVENPLFCTISGLFSRLKGLRIIFWVGDYYPNPRGMFRVFTWLSDYLVRFLPHVAYASPPLKEKYDTLFPGNGSGRFRPVIGLGIKKRYVRRKEKPARRLVIGLIGVIRNEQGLELTFAYMQKATNVTLEIIGDGYWRQYYEKLADSMGIADKVRFYGFVENPDSIIRTWDIGIAPYEQGNNKLSQYAEPTKIKDYLSYGLPVITTRTTYMAEQIRTYHAGCVIDETPESFADAVENIRTSYGRFTRGVDALVRTYEYTAWYDRKFRFMRQ